MRSHRASAFMTLPLGLALLLITTQAVVAADRYGVVSLVNETQTPINYQFRVGDGSWQSRKIMPGEKYWFAHEYERANERRSPAFRVRFDSDLRNGQRFNIEYKLDRRPAIGQGYDYGKKYAFRYDGGDRRYIDLKSID
jgi:hypothetical protein